MVNIPTKFEVSTFSRYGDTKCVKMHKMGVVRGHTGSSAMPPFDRARVISYSDDADADADADCPSLTPR